MPEDIKIPVENLLQPENIEIHVHTDSEPKQPKEDKPAGLLKKVATYIGIGAAIISPVAGGIIWMFSTFASAADIQRLERAQQTMIQKQERQFDEYRKEKYEEKLLELRSRRNPTQEDRAQIEYYQNKLNEVQNKLNRPQ